MEGLAPIVSIAFLLAIVIFALWLSVRVVKQYEKLVVLRFGRTNETLLREPGLRFLIPVIDRPVKVDLRE